MLNIPNEFIRNLYEDVEWVEMLPGVRGASGVRGLPPGFELDENMGLDLIEMDGGTTFPRHTHTGAHILFILEGKGTVTMDSKVYETRPGDTFFIPGGYEHAVGAIERHKFLAIGFPHKQIDDPERMAVI